jgi:Dehydrogenase E1 component
MTKPIQMPTTKPAKAANAASAKPFSLVPAAAQQQMYKALSSLKPDASGAETGAEIAEIAACLAINDSDPVILACTARGARKVRKGSKVVSTGGRRFEMAVIAAVTALLSNSKATVVVCAGKLETDVAAQDDFRCAFDFAARHKLPILFVVAHSYTSARTSKRAPKSGQQLDLRVLSAEPGIPVFSVDANDAIAAYRVTTEALHHARHLRGPSIIEALSVQGHGSRAIDLLQAYMERHGNWPI